MADIEKEIEKLITKTIGAMSEDELAEALSELDDDMLSKIFSALPKEIQEEFTGEGGG